MYQPIKTPKISDAIMAQIEEMVIEGTLRPGQRLPAERELAIQFGVSRPSVREAIQKLVAKGLLQSQQGGGNFVSARIGSSFSDPLLELLAKHPEAQHDLLEFRHALEGLCAYYAALRRTDADKDNLIEKYQALEQHHQNQEFTKEAQADVEFHLAIAEAAHNMVLLHMMKIMFEPLKQNISENLHDIYASDDTRKNLQIQHKHLLDAIFCADPIAAENASHQHFAAIEQALIEQGREDQRLHRSLRRNSVNL